jgi:hemerythrin-like metal-binding protein
MFTKWSDQLLTGNEIIDQQHKEIFERTAQLIESGKTGKIESEAKRIIDYLESYFDRHFAAEEALQIKFGYPGYKAHKEMHEQCLVELSEIKHKFVTHGTSDTLSVESIVFMLNWLAEHINKSDKVLAAYIRNIQSGKFMSVSRSESS